MWAQRLRASASRTPEVRALLVMLTVSAVLSALGAARPLDEETPVVLEVGLGLLSLLLAAGVLLVPWRGMLHVGLGSAVCGLGVLTASTATPGGTAALGLSFTWCVAYAATFFGRRLARTYAATASGVFAVALLANPFVGSRQVWLLTTATCVVATELLSDLVGRLARQAMTDPLTGLLNREGLRRAAERTLRVAQHTGTPATVVVIDLDGFKTVNDRDGHAAGDRLLVALSDAWRGQIRSDDLLARHGGDEFVLVLPYTDLAQARVLLTRLAAVSPAVWSYGTAPATAGRALLDLIGDADRELYAAKAARDGTGSPATREPVPTT